MSSPSWHTLRLSGGLTVAALLSLAGATWSQIAQVTPPPGWYAGDTHVHVQQCDTPVNLTLPEVEVQMEARHLDVVAAQLWGSPFCLAFGPFRSVTAGRFWLLKRARGSRTSSFPCSIGWIS